MDTLLSILVIVIAIPVFIGAFYLLSMLFFLLVGTGGAAVKGVQQTIRTINNPEINERGQPMINRDELLLAVKITLFCAGLFSIIVYSVFFRD